MTLENILLMSLRSPYLDDAKVYPPLGLLYLKAAVEKDLPNVNVDIMDEYDLNNLIPFAKYDLIGLSVMTPQREEAHKVLTTLKRHLPKVKVAIGGPHAFHYFKEVEKEPYDYIVPKDGQRSLIKIIQGKADRIELDNMDKDTWRAQPNPDRTSEKAKSFLSSYKYSLNGRSAGTMLCATGCPEQCTFCEDAMTAVRWRNTADLGREMDDLKNLGHKGVYLFDDLFAIALPMIKPIANELKKRDLIYRCNAQARYFTKWGEDMAKLLADSGCYEIAFGAETGSQKILDNIKKRTTVDQNYKTVEYAKKHGLIVKAFILLGLPGEDWGTLKETEKFIATSGCDDYQIVCYSAYKGTQIRDAIDQGDNSMDIKLLVPETAGAYGIKGGETIYETRTSELSADNLKAFREYLVKKYKPGSHKENWKEDKFFQHQHTEYE